jgi:rhomboid protease GluP
LTEAEDARPRADAVDAGGAPPPAASPAEEAATALAQFHLALREVTSRVGVTRAIVAANVLVFAAMVASGVPFLTPAADRVIRWGANYGPRTLGGQPWRLVANCFLHFGVIHLLMNMWALWDAGHLVERLFGPARFLALYLAAGICGSVAAVALHPQVTSAGASGAVFGVYGALGAFLLRQRGVIPPVVVSRLGRVAAGFIGYNIVFGLANPSIDNAAHIGGLLGGAAAGAWLAWPLALGRGRGLGRAAVVAALSLALVLAPGRVLPRPPDFEATLGAFSASESRLIGVYNDLIARSRQGGLPDLDLAARIEGELLPAWRAARAALTAPAPWRQPQRELVARLDRYAGAREQSWVALAEAVRTRDPAALAKLKAAQDDTTKALDALNPPAP